MVLMGLNQYATHRKIKATSVKQMIAEGKLEGAVKIYLNGVDGKGNPKKRFKIFWQKADRILEGYDDPEQPITSGTKSSMTNLTKARTVKTAMDAKVAQLKYELLSGVLVKKDEVEDIAKQMARLTRESLMTLPDRLAPILAGMDDMEEINKVMRTEIVTALRNLALGNFEFFSEHKDD